MPDESPPGTPRAYNRDGYSLHPLAALDGVLIYVTLHGEAVGCFFGRTEEAAAEAVAAKILDAAAESA